MAASDRDGVGDGWRSLLASVRAAVAPRRDARGVVGSINWLRAEMGARGANPNVVRNIVYRDKGRAADKRVLFDILDELWRSAGGAPLQPPEHGSFRPSASEAEADALGGLGRDKRRAFRAFVRPLREGRHPRLVVGGRPGSGKTLLLDAVQRALEAEPVAEGARVVRLDFASGALGAALTRLGEALGAGRGTLHAHLARVGDSGAYAVQADAQAAVARLLVDAARRQAAPTILLLHVSAGDAAEAQLGSTPLRLSSPDVPRVSAAQWLWHTLLVPLASCERTSLLLSMTHPPDEVTVARTPFEGPIPLAPPTPAAARRFVETRLPQLSAGRRDELVRKAGRSFEDLRTLTLLAEVRDTVPGDARGDVDALTERLAALATEGGDARLQRFLATLGVLSSEEDPTFDWEQLVHVSGVAGAEPNDLERAFLDRAPGRSGRYRCFSRRFARALRSSVRARRPDVHRALHLRAAEYLATEAHRAPDSLAAVHHVEHLLEAGAWDELRGWLRHHGVRQPHLVRIWREARVALGDGDPRELEGIARDVAAHYVLLGSYRHRDALEAFEILAASSDPERRTWVALKRAEGAVQHGHHEEAETWLRTAPTPTDPLLASEAALVRASVARWRGRLREAAERVDTEARPKLDALPDDTAAVRLARARTAVWSGLIHKDRGALAEALDAFASVRPSDELIGARLAFQSGDVQMHLGRLIEARERLTEAVDAAFGHGAIISERTRYLGRRASLRRRLGDIEGGHADVRSGLDALRGFAGEEDERAFWTARLEEERALLRIAEGRAPRAIELLHRVAGAYRAYGERHGVDLSYRLDRVRLRLAYAYAAHAPGATPRHPLPFVPSGGEGDGAAEARHAETLLAPLLRDDASGAIPWSRRELLRTAWLLRARLAPPAEAVRAAELAYAAAAFPHAHAEARLQRAAAHLAAGNPDLARDDLEAARHDLDRIGGAGAGDDPPLRAWADALAAASAAALGDAAAAEAALTRLASAEPLAATVRVAALRRVGAALERAWGEAWSARVTLPGDAGGDPAADAWLRAPERLVVRWQRGQEAPLDPVPPARPAADVEP